MAHNLFAHLSAESPVDHFAQFTSEEHAEFQAHLDAQASVAEPRDSAGDTTPNDADGSGDAGTLDFDCPSDAHLESDFEDRVSGCPGDGSGEDDLADMNANEADDYRNE
jgi:hypothetical protein